MTSLWKKSWFQQLAAAFVVVVGAVIPGKVGVQADPVPEGSAPTADMGSTKRGTSTHWHRGLRGTMGCDLLCEIASAQQAPRFTLDDSGPYPIARLNSSDALYDEARRLVASGDCARALRRMDEGASEAGAFALAEGARLLLRVEALACAGRKEEAKKILGATSSADVPGLEKELHAQKKRWGMDQEADGNVPSLSKEATTYLARRLAEVKSRARDGDLTGALADLDTLDGQCGSAWQRRSVQRMRGDLLARSGRKEDAACTWYRAWLGAGRKARVSISERLDALADQGVRKCQIDLGERLESVSKEMSTARGKTARTAIRSLVRRYRLKGRDRRALESLSRGLVRAAKRDREGALAPLAEAIKRARHPAIITRAEFERATVLRRLDRDDEAIELYLAIVRSAPASLLAPESAFQAGRLSVYRKRYDKAREILADFVVAYPHHARVPDALWHAAWADWRAGNVTGSLRLLERLGTHYGDRTDNSGLSMEVKALYWRARGLGRLGRTDEAIDGYRYVIERFPLTYYAVLAFHRIQSLGVRTEDAVPFMARLPETVGDDVLENLDGVEVPLHPRARRGVALWNTGNRTGAKQELQAQLQFRGAPRGVVEVLASFHAVDGDFSAAHWVATRHGDFSVAPYPGNARLWALAHPLPPGLWRAANEASQETSMDPALALAIIRHESSYRHRSLSGRGAVGVMQLMPQTARNVFKKWYGEAPPSRKGLYKPATNIRAGLGLFALLERVYKGNLPLMIAAYNAGPAVANRWWRNRDGLETDGLVEEMTYPGTRAYVKKVIGSWYAYRVLYGDGEPPPLPLSLPESLGEYSRGGPG